MIIHSYSISVETDYKKSHLGMLLTFRNLLNNTNAAMITAFKKIFTFALVRFDITYIDMYCLKISIYISATNMD